RAVLLLVSHSAGRLLPTIRSRCRRFPLAALTRPVVIQLLRRHRSALAEVEAEAVADLADGSIGRAIELADAGGAAPYRSHPDTLSQIPRIDVTALHSFADKLVRPDAEEAYRAGEELISQFLARMIARSARSESPVGDLIAGEGEIMQHLAVR